MASSSDDFFVGVRLGEVDRVRSILEAGQDVNATRIGLGGFLEIPIFLALEVGEDAMLELLLKHGAVVNQISTCYSVAPLHRIACSPPGHRPASKAQLLLSHGAGVDFRDEWGSTPLNAAAMRGGNDAVAEVLIQNGADLNAVDRVGRTPLHNACIGIHEDVARVLVESGANLNASDNRGRIPIYYAIGKARESVRFLLMEAHAKQLLATDNAHPGLWAQALSTVGHKKTPGGLSVLFSLLQTKPDLFGYLQQDQNPMKRQRFD